MCHPEVNIINLVFKGLKEMDLGFLRYEESFIWIIKCCNTMFLLLPIYMSYICYTLFLDYSCIYFFLPEKKQFSASILSYECFLEKELKVFNSGGKAVKVENPSFFTFS